MNQYLDIVVFIHSNKHLEPTYNNISLQDKNLAETNNDEHKTQ